MVPIRIAENNVIACRRSKVIEQLDSISKQVEDDIKGCIDETELQKNEIYALKQPKQKDWQRVMVKFFRKGDGLPVLQLIDSDGLVNFDKNKMQARKINSPSLLNMDYAQMKVLSTN